MSRDDARLLLLRGQALFDDPEGPSDGPALRALISRLGFVQVDSISAVERAHHLILFTRRHGYRRGTLRTLLEEERLLWEHWTHDASILPIELFSHWKHRFADYGFGERHSQWWVDRFGEDPRTTIDAVLARIRAEGPLPTRAFERPANLGPGGFWNWSPAKAALEHLWRAGELLISRRDGFEKVYDLRERVLPTIHDQPPPERAQSLAALCLAALERLGVGTATEIAGYWAAFPLPEVRAFCAMAARDGVSEAVEVEGGPKGPSWRLVGPPEAPPEVDPGRDDRLPIRLLAPFDPIVRDRARAIRLFGFDYRFEAFTPKDKRVYGYYVLPILQGTHLVGRVDLERKDGDGGGFQVRGLWWEDGVRPTKPRMASLKRAVERLSVFVGDGG